jgi:hypothetical protein
LLLQQQLLPPLPLHAPLLPAAAAHAAEHLQHPHIIPLSKIQSKAILLQHCGRAMLSSLICSPSSTFGVKHSSKTVPDKTKWFNAEHVKVPTAGSSARFMDCIIATSNNSSSA